MFIPSYLTILKLLDGDTVARRSGVVQGDCIVCVNGEGFRRFPPDDSDDDLEHLNGSPQEKLTEDEKKRRAETIKGLDKGEHYETILNRIKEIKAAADPQNPLILQLERHGWDAKANSFGRFLKAREGNIVEAMGMLEKHEQWREGVFPIDLTSPPLQEILKLKAISEICSNTAAPTVYVNYAKLLAELDASNTTDDVVKAFVMYTEILLGKAPDPTHPQTCQFIDLTGVNISISGGIGFRLDILRDIYNTFEPNYPETLHKMVLYPISKTMVSWRRLWLMNPSFCCSPHYCDHYAQSFIIKTFLGFVNSRTLAKIVVTDDLTVVYNELGWDKQEIQASGGWVDFVRKNDKVASDLIIDLS